MNRKSVAGFIVFLMVTAIFSVPAISDENGKETISEFCAEHGDLGLSHGSCVAYLTSQNIVPHDATICRSKSIQMTLDAENHGECVKNLKEMKNSIKKDND